MAPRGMITAMTVLLCFILGLLNPAASSSHMGRSCCTRYNRMEVPFQRIKGYREQSTRENCRIEAIIFYTVMNKKICASRKDEWVRKTLDSLSSKLKKMSKGDSAEGENVIKKSGKPSVNDGSGAFLSTTETYLNSTDSFY